jgi:excisionase family DNA binding protein
MSSQSTEPFLSPDEAAAFLGGMNPHTITRWAREGQIPAYPMGEGKRRLWRFRASDLTKWMISRSEYSIPVDLLTVPGRLGSATDALSRRNSHD